MRAIFKDKKKALLILRTLWKTCLKSREMFFNILHVLPRILKKKTTKETIVWISILNFCSSVKKFKANLARPVQADRSQ